MANIKSAKKRISVNKRQRTENKYVKATVNTYIKKFKKAIEDKNLELAEGLLKETTSLIQSAKSKGVYHKNNASRKVARLSKALHDLKGNTAPAVKPAPAAKKAVAEKPVVVEDKVEDVAEVKEAKKAPAKKATTKKAEETTEKKPAAKKPAAKKAEEADAEKPAKKATTAKKPAAKKAE